MAKFKKRRKMGKLGRTLLTIGCIALCIACLGSIVAFAHNDAKPAGAIFKVGGLDETTGKYVKNNQAIYTEKAFLCYGLKIVPDFEFTGTYDVYYYDSNDVLITKQLGLKDTYKSDVDYAQYARIVIHPEVPDGVKASKWKIGYLEAKKIGLMLDISVSKELGDCGNFDDLFEGAVYQNEKGFECSGGGVSSTTVVDSPENKISNFVSLDDATRVRYVVTYEYPPETASFHLVFVNDNGEFISQYRGDTNNESGLDTLYVDVPEDAAKVAVMVANDAIVRLYIVEE